MYQKFLDGDEDVEDISEEEDPFWEPTEDVLIGTGAIFLQSLAYALDFDDNITISDYKVRTLYNEKKHISMRILPFPIKTVKWLTFALGVLWLYIFVYPIKK